MDATRAIVAWACIDAEDQVWACGRVLLHVGEVHDVFALMGPEINGRWWWAVLVGWKAEPFVGEAENRTAAKREAMAVWGGSRRANRANGAKRQIGK